MFINFKNETMRHCCPISAGHLVGKSVLGGDLNLQILSGSSFPVIF